MENKFAASQSYGLDKSRFHLLDSAFDVVLGLASNLLGWMPWLWDVSAGLVEKWGFGDRGGDIPTSLVFVGLALVIQASFFRYCSSRYQKDLALLNICKCHRLCALVESRKDPTQPNPT